MDALFHQAGVIRATSLEELVDVAALLATQPMPRGRRVAILTNAGGLGILCADACEAAGLELPQPSDETVRRGRPCPVEASLANPIDMLGSATASYRAVLPLLLDDPGLDAVIALFVPLSARPPILSPRRSGTNRQPRRQAGPGRGHERRRHSDTPPQGHGGAAFTYPESAARALGRAAERADWLRRPLGVAELDGIDRATASVVENVLATRTSGGSIPRSSATADRLRAPARRGARGASADGAVTAADRSASRSS